MSDRQVDINLSNTNELVMKPSKEDEIAFREQVARVLDRGLIVDRLSVDLSGTGLYGEWIGTDAVSQATAALKGFVPGDEYAAKSGLNDAGDGTVRNVDVRFMVMPIWKKKIIDQVRQDNYVKAHLTKQQKEQKDFVDSNKAIGMPTENAGKSLDSSDVEVKTGPQIQEALTPTKKE